MLLIAPVSASAQQASARGILIIDQSEQRGPFFTEIYSGFRAELGTGIGAPNSLYSENIDLSRFGGEAYEESLRGYLEGKYRDKDIGVIVAMGAGTLDLVLRWRDRLWPGIPVVFGMVDEATHARLKLPDNVTGSILKTPLSDAIKAAQAVDTELETIVFVGDHWERQNIFGSWGLETAKATAGLNVIDLVGATMADVRKKVEALPARSVIIYSAIYSDGKGTYFSPATAFKMVAEKANRPIVVAAEPLLALGSVGGFVLVPGLIGADTAKLTMRILRGEAASTIPATISHAIKPIFNWLQMQRWDVSESDLPAGSEIRFREPGVLEKYRWQSAAAIAIMLIQAGLISFLLHERKRRNEAEAEARSRMTLLVHANRQATAGELSSSIAHELNQPLGAILTNTETAELILASPSPDMVELKEILADIKRDDLRANEVIIRLRSLLKREPFQLTNIDLNAIMHEVFGFLSVQASARNIALYLKPSAEPLWVQGDPVQLQQVILNLLVNSMDAMSGMPYGRTVIGRTEKNGAASAVIMISDTGPGIPNEKLNEVFDPFFTTKREGMGIGLSIARTIIQAHKGRIWAENQTDGGAVFCLSLPLVLS